MARDDPQMKIRLPEELKEGIERAARESGRTLNAEVVARLQDSLDGKSGPLIDDDMLRQLREAAKETGRSVSGELHARLVSSLAELPPAELLLRGALDDAHQRNGLLAAEIEQLQLDLRSRSNTLYILLDSSGYPISWDQVHAILAEIRESGGIKPRELNVTVLTPDMESSSRRAAETAELVKILRARGGPMFMDSNVLELQTAKRAELAPESETPEANAPAKKRARKPKA